MTRAVTKRVTLSKRKRRVFLEILSRTGKVTDAAQSVGYTNTSFLHRMYREDKDFAREWDAALESAGDVLEDEAIRRAVDGVREPVYYQGKVVGHKLNYSDQLLMFLLKGTKPDKFADRKKIEGTIEGKIGVALLPMTAPNPGS